MTPNSERNDGPPNELERWLDEYYRVNGAVPDFEAMTPLEAAEHALRKWEGLTTLKTEYPNLRYKYHTLMNTVELEQAFVFASQSCALCHHFLIPPDDSPDDTPDCLLCPLYSTLGDESCDTAGLYNLCEDDPRPMVAALQRTVARLRQQAQPDALVRIQEAFE